MISSRHIAQAVYELAQEGHDSMIHTRVFEYLQSHNLLSLLGNVMHHLEQLYETEKRHQTLQITSAQDMSESFVKELKKTLSAHHVAPVVVHPELQGGFIAEYQGVVYDASVKTQLEKLKQILKS